MATVGQQLTAPESGWTRYDNTNVNIIYSGTWMAENGSSHYNATSIASTVVTSTIKFNFTGTKLRIISPKHPDFAADIKISIDGISYYFSENAASLVYQILVFEKLDLVNDFHSVVISFTNKKLSFDAIDIYGSLSTAVGQPLTSPESSWSRYDDNDANITIVNPNLKLQSSPSMWNGTEHWTSVTGNIGINFQFNFVGSRLRILSGFYTDRTDSVAVYIDGIKKGVYSAKLNSTYSVTQLAYECLNLEYKEHYVQVVVETTGKFSFDAIDINQSGTLKPYNTVLLRYLIKQSNSYYSVDSSHYDTSAKGYVPLTLSGGLIPNTTDIETQGFATIDMLLSPITVNGETFRPVDKLFTNFEIKSYAHK